MEGPGKVHISYRGVPVMVTTEQLRLASRGELETHAQADLMDQLLEKRKYSVHQRGFVDARGQGPPTPGGEEVPPPTGEPVPDHQPAEPSQPDPHAGEQPVPETHGEDDHDMGEGREGEEKDDVLDDISDEEFVQAEDGEAERGHTTGGGAASSSSTTATQRKRSETATSAGPDRKRLRTALRTVYWSDVLEEQQQEAQRRRRQRGVDSDYFNMANFVCRRQAHLVKKGRELKRIPGYLEKEFEGALLKEWSKWIKYDAVEIADQETVAGLQEDEIMPLRVVKTDKNEMSRGNRTVEEWPVVAKCRIVTLGFKDKQALQGKLRTDASTLTPEATAIMLTKAAEHHKDWRFEHGDVESAFLNGKYLNSERRVFLRVPKGGFPAIRREDGTWFPAVPAGTILRARKGVFGLKDAPLLWFLEHQDSIIELGGVQSRLCPCLFIFRTKTGKLRGLIGVHVDDDMIAGDNEFFKEVVEPLKKKYCYGKWSRCNEPGESFEHCGRVISRRSDGALVVSQRNYALGLEPLYIAKERRRTPEAKVTAEERQQLRSGNGKVAWLTRSTRMDLAFQLARSQQVVDDPDLTVESLLEFNRMVNNAKKDEVNLVYFPVDLKEPIVLAIGDASWGNVGSKKTKSQAGYIILVADNRDDKFMKKNGGIVNVMTFRSHLIRRVVRSTVAAETMGALEAVE